MSGWLDAAAIALVCVATVLIAARGLGRSRTTEDFFVAARSVRPWWNASAIGGEYLSAASFLGVVGLIVLTGRDGLWFPVGYAAGFLMLLLFVAAPLRRSGAYTLPDFALVRFGDERVARALGYVVLCIGWLYMVPQMHGAALAVRAATGAPAWLGPLIVTAVVIGSVVPGGMRSITLVQAVQYWIKLAALAVPTVILALSWLPHAAQGGPATLPDGHQPPLFTVSLLVALVFGTMGLPHVLVRFYTNPDGDSARGTTLMVTGLVSLFYLFPTALGFLAVLAGVGASPADATVLMMPSALLGGWAGTVLTAVVVGGAFAAFVSTSSGLCVALAGVISRRFFAGSVKGFRRGALIAALVPCALALATSSSALAGVIGSVFALTASTIAPLLLSGIWFKGTSPAGAIAGLAVGAASCAAALALGWLGVGASQPWAGLLTQPALFTVPLACATVALVSWRKPQAGHHDVDAVMTRLHTP